MGLSAAQTAQMSMIGQIGGAANSAVGSFYSSRSQAASLGFQADISGINARIAEMGAQSALAQGQQQVGQLTMRAGKVKGAQRAALAANGVDLGVGNAAEVLATTDLTKEIDRNTLESNAVKAAWGYRAQSSNFMSDAMMKRANAGSISPMGSAVTSLLGSAGNVASSWYGLNKAGAFGESPTLKAGQYGDLQGRNYFGTWGG